MEKVNFSSSYYKDFFLKMSFDPDSVHHPYDAFLLLIHGISYDSLDNLLFIFADKIGVSLEKAYILSQDFNLSFDYKRLLFLSSIECIKSKPLGNGLTNDGKFNKSAWLGHSLNVGLSCFYLANNIGLKENVALTLGILHDYGRKFDHSFNHIIKGAESLVDLNYPNEAIGCLTHSFVEGKRCAYNEKAIDGFTLDENGDAYYINNFGRDDMLDYLEKYQYSGYDLLLNIADLMATNSSIVNPFIRLKDIASRREIDLTNRGYFLASFINLLIKYLNVLGYYGMKPIYNAVDYSLNELEMVLFDVSNFFYDLFAKDKRKDEKIYCLENTNKI